MNEEIILKHADYSACVSTLGASLRRFSRAGRDLIWGYSGDLSKRAGQGDVLIPFPGRIPGGTYYFGGREYQLKLNDKEGPNAIHGFVRDQAWKVRRDGGSRAIFELALLGRKRTELGYPFDLSVRVTYGLDDAGLRCDFEIRNIGPNAAPVAAGFHPYFCVGEDAIDGWELELPAQKLIEFDAGFRPTGRVLPIERTNVDFRRSRVVGNTRINNCFAKMSRDQDGRARSYLKNPITKRTLTLWMDEAFDYLVVYTGEAIEEPHRRRSVAIEPMTCGTDGFNRPEWGRRDLAPSESFIGSWGADG